MVRSSPQQGADRARLAAARAAVELLDEGMTIGLGSGRAVWTVVELIAARWPHGAPLRGVVACARTAELARKAGIELIDLDGRSEIELLIDGADEFDRELRLLKGGGGALLREKILAAASARFVAVAEAAKQVDRLGERARLPVEVVTFGWRATALGLEAWLDRPQLREDGTGRPFMTDEGHFILDCVIPPDVEVERLGAQIASLPGVVEHGLFIGLAGALIAGSPDGSADMLSATAHAW